MSDAEKRHVAAAEYANRRRANSIAYRTEKKLLPVNQYATDDIWLAHYEGFKDGMVAGSPPPEAPFSTTGIGARLVPSEELKRGGYGSKGT